MDIIDITDTFILSEIQNSIKDDWFGIGILFVVLILLIIWLLFVIKEIRKKLYETRELSKKNRMGLLDVFALIFLIFICGLLLDTFYRSVDDVLIKQYAVNNYTYEVKEYKVADKHFEIFSPPESNTEYRFYLELENFGEVAVSEVEYDKVTIGDTVYFIFAVKGAKACNIGNIYLG